ncbi:hypothetical protein B0H11DRAFT_1927508 [Mycena galericulata]|nr:hypothetical protein B0H11DRAFT_1927508 [Mycena galericulata]
MATDRDVDWNQSKAFIRKARQDVETFLKTPTNILPDFPTSMEELGLVNIEVSAEKTNALEIAETLGKMFMMGTLADVLTTMFAGDDGVVGSSSWIRDVLISESTRTAIATRFNWTSANIDKAHIIYHMMAGLHDSETIERGDEDLERWAGEFFKQLAQVANKTRQSGTRGVYVPSFVHAANDLKSDKRPSAVIQMEEYLQRQRAGEQIPMVPGWLDEHEVVKELLKDE